MKKLISKWRELNTRIQKSGLDAALHIGFGGIVAALLCHCGLPWYVAFGVPVGIGTAKELTDINFDIKDIAGYAVGAGVSVIIMTVAF